MINIILYVFIGIGVGYFVYLFYKKWPELSKQDVSGEISVPKSIRVFSEKFFNILRKYDLKNKAKRLWMRLRRAKPLAEQDMDSLVNAKTSRLTALKKINFKKALQLLKSSKDKLTPLARQTAKGIKIVYKKGKNIAGFLTKQAKKIKLPAVKLPKPRFLENKISETKLPFFKKHELKEEAEKKESAEVLEEKPQEHIEVPVAEKAPKVSLEKSKLFILDKQGKIKDFLKEKQWGSKLSKNLSSIKNRVKKIDLKKGFDTVKKVPAKIKARFRSEEDERMKKHLQEKPNSVIQPESYLGELLKKTEEEKKPEIEFKTVTLPEEEKEEKKLMAEIEENIEVAQPAVIKQEKPVQKMELSQETINKIEDRLIHEIAQDPKNIEAYKRLGKLYYHQFKYKYAKECFDAALKLGSGDKKIQRLLRKCEERIIARQNKI